MGPLLIHALVLVASCAPKTPPAPAAEPPRAERATATEPWPEPVNLSFEEGWDGWFVGGPPDGDADAFVVADGTRSARLRGVAGQWGTWTQCASAGAWRGGQVTLTARMRTADVSGDGAGLWLRIDDGTGQDRKVLAFDNSAGRMLTGDTGWTSMEITLPVADEADVACFGMLLVGEGTAWIDDLRFRAAPVLAAIEGPLADRSVTNLEVLAQIWGAARYFVPPIDEVEIDWDRLLVEAIPVVEAAADDDALAAALARAFEPAYGAVRIVPETPVAPPTPSTREVESGVLYVVPGDSAVDPGDARAVVVDLRGGAPLPDALLTTMARNPAEIPRVRWTLHEGYYAIDPSRREQGYDVVLAEERTGRIVPSGGPPWPATTLLVDTTTAPEVLGPVAALQRTWAEVVGSTQIGSPRPPHVVDLPGDRVAHVLVRPFARAVVPDVHVPPGADPLAAALSDAPPPEAPPAAVASPTARDKRLANVVLVWATLKWFYPYWEDAGPVDWDAALGTALRGAGLDGTVREVVVARDARPEEVRRGDLSPGGVARDLGDGILYIDLDIGLGDGTRTEAILAGLEQAASAKGLVLDLRGYPDWTGTFEVVARLASRPARSMRLDTPWLEGPGPPVAWGQGQWSIDPAEPHLDLPVAVLIDGRAVSRAEHFAAVFAINDLATLVGAPTSGTNGEIVSIQGFDGLEVGFTGMRAWNDDGTRHLGVGVIPDVVVERTPPGIAEGRDEQVERAIGIVRP